jgi:hypothetical protein
MIDIDKLIEDISEKELKKYIVRHLNQTIIENNYECFINFLKDEPLSSQYICNAPDEKAILFLTKIVNCFNMKNIDIDSTLKLIRDNARYTLTRCSDWNICKVPLINDSSNEMNINCGYSEYKDSNKWGNERTSSTYKIMYDDKRVLWFKDSYNEPQYFISKNAAIYGISYEHKIIKIYNTIDKTFKDIIINNNNFDEIVNQYGKIKYHIEETKIDLSEYFYKGFFYKGTLFDRNWKQRISILKSIHFINGLLKIEIENLTYPHVGYILLEIGTNKIIDAKNVKVRAYGA